MEEVFSLLFRSTMESRREEGNLRTYAPQFTWGFFRSLLGSLAPRPVAFICPASFCFFFSVPISFCLGLIEADVNGVFNI